MIPRREVGRIVLAPPSLDVTCDPEAEAFAALVGILGCVVVVMTARKLAMVCVLNEAALGGRVEYG